MNFYQVLPNIWICILKPEQLQNNSNNVSPNTILSIFAKEKNITQLVKAHKDLAFFGKSIQYIDVIKSQMERDEIKKMYNYLLKITKKLFDYYIQGENTLIISGIDMYKSIAIIITFLIKYADMSLQQSFNAVKSKMTENIKIPNNYVNVLLLVEKMDSN